MLATLILWYDRERMDSVLCLDLIRQTPAGFGLFSWLDTVLYQELWVRCALVADGYL